MIYLDTIPYLIAMVMTFITIFVVGYLWGSNRPYDLEYLAMEIDSKMLKTLVQDLEYCLDYIYENDLEVYNKDFKDIDDELQQIQGELYGTHKC